MFKIKEMEQAMCDWVLEEITKHSGTPERFISKYRFFPEWLANLRRGKMCTMRTFFRLIRILGYKLRLNDYEVYSTSDMALTIRDIRKDMGLSRPVFQQKYTAMSGDKTHWAIEKSRRTLNFKQWASVVIILRINYRILKFKG